MTVVLLTMVVFLLAAAGLSLGILLGRGAIRGSCRAMADTSPEGGHCACSEPCPRRKRALARAARLAEETQP
jgi:hypothetical protein